MARWNNRDDHGRTRRRIDPARSVAELPAAPDDILLELCPHRVVDGRGDILGQSLGRDLTRAGQQAKAELFSGRAEEDYESSEPNLPAAALQMRSSVVVPQSVGQVAFVTRSSGPC